MSTRLPCCFMVFYDYPSWRTGGSPFMSQVPGYLRTHIIHSFLTILNYKTVCACRSSIMDIPPVPKTFKFPQRSFGQKNPVKRIFQSSWFAKMERGYITMRQMTSRIVLYAWLLTETESRTVWILIRRSYTIDFSYWKDATWPLKTRLFQVPSWFGEGSKYLCSVCLCCQMLKRNNSQEYFFQHNYKIDWIYKPKLHSRCSKNASTAFLNLFSFSGEILRTPLTRGENPPLVLSPSRAFGTRGMLSASHGRTTFQKPATALSLGWLWVDKKAMIRSRYNRVPHPAPDTKRERDNHNQDGI